MEHNEAIENHTAERYLLHELTEQERDAYEAHFFSCSACAEEINADLTIMENARQVVQDELKAHIYSHAARRSVWDSWLTFRSMLHPIPAAACALLVMVSAFGIYQNVVTIPQLKQDGAPQLAMSESFVLRNAKSAIHSLTFSKGKSFTIPFEVPTSTSSSYEIWLVSATTAKKLRFPAISATEAKKPLEIIVPAGKLDAGSYFLLI